MDSTLGEHDPSATTTREVSRAFEESEVTKDEALKKAFKQAFQLGQDYWYQADHEYESQNKKSDVTRAKFEQLMEDAIKEALAQPEQERVAQYSDIISDGGLDPRNTTPPQRTWVGLTDEDLKLLSAEWRIVYGAWMDDFARDIEAKLKEKNT